MPIVPHDKKIEPRDDAEIWRFLKMEFFRDLMANEELYFRRTDLYKNGDPSEGRKILSRSFSANIAIYDSLYSP